MTEVKVKQNKGNTQPQEFTRIVDSYKYMLDWHKEEFKERFYEVRYNDKGEPVVGMSRNLVTNPLSDAEIKAMFEAECESYRGMLSKYSFWKKLSKTRQMIIMGIVSEVGLDAFKDFKPMHDAMSKEDFKTAADYIRGVSWGLRTDKSKVEHYMEALELNGMRNENTDA